MRCASSGEPGKTERDPARAFLRTVGSMCTQIADSSNDSEVCAALHTLEDMPRFLQRRGLSQVRTGERK
jgi:hypothetical protein